MFDSSIKTFWVTISAIRAVFAIQEKATIENSRSVGGNAPMFCSQLSRREPSGDIAMMKRGVNNYW